MRILKIFFTTLFLISIFSKTTFSAEKDKAFDGKGGRDDFSYLKAKNSNFKKGKDAFKQALKYERKNKIKKASQKFEKALNYFELAYNENPNNIEVLSFLGFAYFKFNDNFMAEIYYQEALEIDPKNPLINKRLGELYYNTKRADLAKERLRVLSSCNCQEYLNLKKIISVN